MVKSKTSKAQMNVIKRFIPFILIGIVVSFSLEKTLQYYFYTDDFAFLYYLQNNLNFGWPYNSVLTLFRPVYQLFGINPLPYFTLAFITYFFASFSVYLFARKLSRNNLIAISSSLIFATGYVGLDQFGMIAVSIINNINIINVCITLILWIFWIETKKIKYYFLTLFMFWISFLLFPYRAYPLVLFLPTLQFMKTLDVGSLKRMSWQIIFIILYFIPFFVVAILRGVFSYGTHGTDSVNLFHFFNSDSKLFIFLNIEFLKELFGVLGKLILVKPLMNILNITADLSLYAYVGFIFFSITVLMSFILIRKKKNDGRNLLIVLLLTIEAYVGNMILNVDFDSNGPVNRYLTIAFLPFSILIPLFLFVIFERIKFKWISKKWTLIFVIILIVLSFASMSRKYEKGVLEDRSNPSRIFFKELKTFIPTLSDSTYNVFYFDRASYFPISSRFGNVLLSAAMGNSVNLAVPYGIDIESIKIVDTFDQFLRFVIYPPDGRKINYYTFYNNEKGLQNTTSQVFALLENGSSTKISNDQVHYVNEESTSLIKIESENVSSLTPMRVKFSLRASPKDPSTLTFPYIGKKDESVKDYYERNQVQRSEIFRYLTSREKYYKTVNVDVESIHIAKQNPDSYLVDEKAETVWLSDQSRWEVNIKPWIKVDLSENRNIGRIVWHELQTRLIDKYTISTSSDGKTWTKVKNISQKNYSNDPTLKIIDFDNINARYILVNIDELAYGSPGPGLAEIEVIENEFKNVDLESAFRVSNSPFEYIENSEDLSETYDYLRQNAKLSIKALTNRDDPNSNLLLTQLPIFLDGQQHEYEFQLPSGGTELKNIKLEANFPADLVVEDIIIENITLNVLKEEIKEKCHESNDLPEWINPFDCN